MLWSLKIFYGVLIFVIASVIILPFVLGIDYTIFTPLNMTSDTSNDPVIADQSRFYYSEAVYGGWSIFKSPHTDEMNFDSGSCIGDWVSIDLGSGVSKVATQIKVTNIIRNAANRIIQGYKLQGSNNNADWTDITSALAPDDLLQGTETTHTFESSTSYRYFRIIATADSVGGNYGGWAVLKIYESVITDTCTCAGAGNDWEIDHSDYCNITDACDLTTGTLSFTGTGITRLNSTIKTTNLGDPGATGILKILSNCLIWIKGT